MTKKEFEERTGLSVTDEQYSKIEAMYLDAGESIDKDVFCKDYKKHADSVLLKVFHQRTQILCDKLDNLRTEKQEIAKYLILSGSRLDDMNLNLKAADILGEREYLRLKIALKVPFQEYDYQIVQGLL